MARVPAGPPVLPPQQGSRCSTPAEELTQRVLLKVVNACCSDIEVRNVRAWLY